MTTWLDHYVRPDDLYVIAMRDEGQLVAVAPFYRRRPRYGVVSGGSCLQLVGAGRDEHVTEIPEILVGQRPRQVLRALVAHLLTECSDDWDWVELTLAPRLGWFESDWVTGSGAKFDHTNTAAFVVVDLPRQWDEFRGGLKRNVKEAVRRSSNRLARTNWEYALPADPEQLQDALDALIRLHRARSGVADKRRHEDYVVTSQDESFVRAAARAMFEVDAATVPRLRVEGVDAAARLVLRGNGALFFSVSGLDPALWDYGAGTALVTETLRAAIEHDDRTANLSRHPDETKLRWSERLEFHHDFVLVSPRRRGRLALAAHLMLRSARRAYNLYR